MKSNLWLNVLAGILASVIFAVLLSSGLPLQYAFGFLLGLLIIFIFAGNSLYFLFGLFLFRPAIDDFLVSIRIALGGMDLGMGGILSLFLCTSVIFTFLFNPRFIKRLHHPVIYLYLFFTVVEIFTFFNSPDPSSGVKALLKYFSILAVMVLIIMNIRREKDAYVILRAFIYSAIFPVLIGCVKLAIDGPGRFQGSFGHPNILGSFIVLILACLIVQVDQPLRFKKFSFGRIFYILFLIVPLVMTMTRSSWGALLLFALIYAVCYNRSWILPFLFIFCIAGLTPFVQERITDTIGSYGQTTTVDDESSLGWRMMQWQDLYTKAIKKPWTGYGLYADVRLSDEEHAAHNDYLKFFIESGVFGVISYFSCFFYLFLSALKYQHERYSNLTRKISILFICYIPTFLIVSYVENMASYIVIHWYLWGMMAVLIASQSLEVEQKIRAKRYRFDSLKEEADGEDSDIDQENN